MKESEPSKKELLSALREAYVQLTEHNKDYHHITPKEFLDRISKLLEEDQSVTEEGNDHENVR